MNHYELMVIFSSALTDDEEKEQSNQVQELIKKEKGNVYHIDRWGKRKLAYVVKKQRQGYYEWYYFEIDPSRISEIDRKLKMAEPILRFMCLKMEKVQIQNLQRDMARRSEAAAAAAAAHAETPAPVEVVESGSEPAAEEVPAQDRENVGG